MLHIDRLKHPVTWGFVVFFASFVLVPLAPMIIGTIGTQEFTRAQSILLLSLAQVFLFLGMRNAKVKQNTPMPSMQSMQNTQNTQTGKSSVLIVAGAAILIWCLIGWLFVRMPSGEAFLKELILAVFTIPVVICWLGFGRDDMGHHKTVGSFIGVQVILFLPLLTWAMPSFSAGPLWHWKFARNIATSLAPVLVDRLQPLMPRVAEYMTPQTFLCSMFSLLAMLVVNGGILWATTDKQQRQAATPWGQRGPQQPLSGLSGLPGQRGPLQQLLPGRGPQQPLSGLPGLRGPQLQQGQQPLQLQQGQQPLHLQPFQQGQQLLNWGAQNPGQQQQSSSLWSRFRGKQQPNQGQQQYPNQGGQQTSGQYPNQGGQQTSGQYPNQGGQPTTWQYPNQGGQQTSGQYPNQGGQQTSGQYPNQGGQPTTRQYPNQGGQPTTRQYPNQGGQPTTRQYQDVPPRRARNSQSTSRKSRWPMLSQNMGVEFEWLLQVEVPAGNANVLHECTATVEGIVEEHLEDRKLTVVLILKENGEDLGYQDGEGAIHRVQYAEVPWDIPIIGVLQDQDAQALFDIKDKVPEEEWLDPYPQQ